MAVLWYYLFAFGEEGRERRFGNVNWVEKGKERILERVEEYSTVCVCVCVLCVWRCVEEFYLGCVWISLKTKNTVAK